MKFSCFAVSFAVEPVHKMKALIRLGKHVVVALLVSAIALHCTRVLGQTPSRIRGGQPARTGLVSPLNIPLVLAGNFGELRSNHFHTGLDFKTLGREGLPVIAVTDGVVSRVRTGPYGYGNALYVSSPDGLTSVYAHLQQFAEPISTWLCEEQYRSEENEWDAAPRRAFTFKAGDTLGWSGNSGSSGGPHLHFEIRETATQRPINPLFWDFDVADNRAPRLDAVWLLPEPGAMVDGRSTPVRLDGDIDRVQVSGSVRVAVEAFDRLSGANNVCGVYRMAVAVDSVPWFEASLDTLDFSVARDMNAHAYYPVWSRERKQVHRMHRLPGNRLPIYDRTTRSGIIEVLPGLERSVHVFVEDVHGNAVERTVRLIGAVQAPASEDERPPGALLRYDTDWSFSDSTGLRVDVPKDAFYDDAWFPCHAAAGGGWYIGSESLPVRKAISVELPENAGCGVRGHVAVQVEEGESFRVEPARLLAGGGIRFTTRNLGLYRAACDTVGPRIAIRSSRPSGLPENPRMEALQFEVTDDFSGVAEVQAWVEGCWMRLHWDPKKDRAFYLLEDGRHLPGEHQEVLVEARDEAGNVSAWRGTVIWP